MVTRVQADSSFISLPGRVGVADAEASADAAIASTGDGETQVVHFEEEQCRHAPSSCRDTSLDNTRLTVNTHTSILDLTKDEEEESDDEDADGHRGILFGDLYDDEQAQNEEFPLSSQPEDDVPKSNSVGGSAESHQGKHLDTRAGGTCAGATSSASTVSSASTGSATNSLGGGPAAAHPSVESSTSPPLITHDIPPEYLVPRIHKPQKLPFDQEENISGSILKSFSPFHLVSSDGFVDSLCPADVSSSGQCTSKVQDCGANISDTVQGCTTATSRSARNIDSRVQLNLDIMQLMGCAGVPGASELEDLWAINAMQCNTRSSDHSAPPPTQGELSDESTKRPARASIKERMVRIRRLRMERSAGQPTRHGRTYTSGRSRYSSTSRPTNQEPVSLRRANTMDDTMTSKRTESSLHAKRRTPSLWSSPDDTLSSFIGQGIDPIMPFRINDTTINENDMNVSLDALCDRDDSGYDSDPELPGFTDGIVSPLASDNEGDDEDFHFNPLTESAIPTHVATINEQPGLHVKSQPQYEVSMDRYSLLEQDHGIPAADSFAQDELIRISVQETLNTTWTLTWHPNEQNMAEFGISSKPICINIWIERGTVIPQTGIVSEPLLMWRHAYQPQLQQRRLNASTQKPWGIRLLNTCRISEVSSPSQLNRSKYPLARKDCSFFLRTCQEQEFLLEASSLDERFVVCDRWKTAVARFASLAVSEDIDCIADEFFYKSTPDVCEGAVVGNSPF